MRFKKDPPRPAAGGEAESGSAAGKVKTQKTSGQVLALVVPEPEPAIIDVEDTDPTAVRMEIRKRIRWGRWIVVGVVALVLGAALVATSLLVYQQAEQKRLRKKLKHVRSMLSLDTAVAYTEAARTLRSLRRERPDSADIAVTLATTEAVLWGRFDGGARSRKAATQGLKDALRLKASPESVGALRGLMLLFGGKPEQAAHLAERALVHHRASAALRYVLGAARMAMGDLDAAEATLQLAISHDKHFLPAKYHLAVVQRLRGRHTQSQALLKELLGASSNHLGARIEEALILLETRSLADPVKTQKLAERARPYPPYRARVELLMGKNALKMGDRATSLKHIRQAAVLRPAEPEYTLALADLHLRPDGDVAKARLAAGSNQSLAREYPGALLLFARLSVETGSPRGALKHLSELRTSGLTSRELSDVRAVKVRALAMGGEAAASTQLCKRFLAADKPRTAGEKALSGKVLDACMGHAVRHGRTKLAQSIHRHAADKQSRRLYRAARYIMARRPSSALKELRKVEKDRMAPLLYLKSKALTDALQPRAALAVLKQALKHQAGSATARLNLAWGWLRVGRRRQALSALKQLKKLKPESQVLLYGMGRLALAAGSRKQAVALAARLIKEHPQSPLGYHLTGLAHMKRRRWKSARKEFSKALARAPDHAESKVALARLAFRRADQSTGRILFQEAYRARDRDPFVLETMARTYLERKNLRAAMKLFIRAANKYRARGSRYKASELYSELAEIFSAQENFNRTKVESWFKKAVRMRETHPLAYFRWANYLRKRGKDDVAAVWYRRATRSCPELTEAHYSLGWILLHKDRNPRKALAAMQKVVQLDGRGSHGRRASKWIRRLKKKLRRQGKR